MAAHVAEVVKFTALPLDRWRAPFDHPDWLYELKLDGFRALAFVDRGTVRLVSRTGYVYRAYRDLALAIAAELRTDRAVLDGELVCLRPDGRPNFVALLRRQAPASMTASWRCSLLDDQRVGCVPS